MEKRSNKKFKGGLNLKEKIVDFYGQKIKIGLFGLLIKSIGEYLKFFPDINCQLPKLELPTC